MSKESVPINIRILDKDFRIACSENEKEGLVASARFLDERMNEIRRGGKVIGAERIAIMAALNISHELLLCQNEQQKSSENMANRIRNLQDRIDIALSAGNQLEL